MSFYGLIASLAVIFCLLQLSSYSLSVSAISSIGTSYYQISHYISNSAEISMNGS